MNKSIVPQLVMVTGYTPTESAASTGVTVQHMGWLILRLSHPSWSRRSSAWQQAWRARQRRGQQALIEFAGA
jgi:hypothetical protein